MSEYYQKNKEKLRAYQRQYYHANKEKCAAFRKKWLDKVRNDPEYRKKTADTQRRYVEANKERIAENRKRTIQTARERNAENAAIIRTARKLANVTIQEIADRLGCSKQRISLIENGTTNADPAEMLRTIRQIAQDHLMGVMRFSFEYLHNGAGNKKECGSGISHDATHCTDYCKAECPELCYRAVLTKDLTGRTDLVGVPLSWASFKGSEECPMKEEK